MDLLDGLWVALQPVVDLMTGCVLGHEALIRGPEGSDRETPDQLFAQADAAQVRVALELTCRTLAINALFHALPPEQMLFLNVDLTLGPLPIDPLGRDLPWDRIGLEISEHHPVPRDSAALDQINEWRTQGYGIVLDDYGVGYSSLGMAITVHPHILKLDRELVQNIDQNPFGTDVIRSMVAMWHDKNIRIVAEGIETPEELHVLQALGVDYGQGFYLGRPARWPVTGPIRAGSAFPSTPPSYAGPYAPVQVWSDADQAQWRTAREALRQVHQRFVEHLPAILPPTNAAGTLAARYGENLPADPRVPLTREYARQLGYQLIRAGISPSWFILVYDFYFAAYHQASSDQIPDLPPLPLFRRRWLWDVADTLDAFTRSGQRPLKNIT